jgi:pimeloyl-ACP methyl ester carboxylesterase
VKRLRKENIRLKEERDILTDPTVVVPDRRGMGLSSHPADGDDKRTQAADVRAVRTLLGRERAVIAGHGLGPLVAYADAARSPDTTSSRRQ